MTDVDRLIEEGHPCLTPRGSGEVLGIRRCDILKRQRVSVLMDELQADGTRYAVFDREEVTRACTACHLQPAVSGNMCRDCAEIYDFAQEEAQNQRRDEQQQAAATPWYLKK
jgi:hypothetical protein